MRIRKTFTLRYLLTGSTLLAEIAEGEGLETSANAATERVDSLANPCLVSLDFFSCHVAHLPPTLPAGQKRIQRQKFLRGPKTTRSPVGAPAA